jgi:hypothetical protein
MFAALIVMAACFKVLPALFLMLLLLPTRGGRPSNWLFGAGVAALVAVTLGPTLVGPAASFQKFWTAVPDATGYGDANPSALGLLAMLAQLIGASGANATLAANVLWGAYAVGLIVVSLGLLRAAWERRDERLAVMCAVFLYVLLLPRPMAYGFVILTPAPFFFAPKPFNRTAGRLVLALVLSAQGLWRLTSIRSDSFLVTYAPFLLTLCIWLLVVNEHSESRAQASAGRPEVPEPALELAS